MVSTISYSQHFADGLILGLVAVTITYITGWVLGKMIRLMLGRG